MLFVSDERGWPPRSGYRRRTSQILRSLAEAGPVTWVAAPRNRFGDDGPLEVPADLRDVVETVLVPAPTHGAATTLRRWLTQQLPWPLAAGDWTQAVAELQRRNGEPYDLLWTMGVDALHAAQRAGITAASTVVDADLESLKLRRQLQWDDGGRLRRIRGRIDAARWERLEQQAADSITSFSLCSEDEVRVLGREAWVTPNGFEEPDPLPAGERCPGSLLFIGSLSYAPNIDGLRYFARDVIPLIVAGLPEVRLRVVGAGLAADDPLHQASNVEVIGPVDDTTPYLRTAQLVVVPLRWGAGTRIKILEAFAHGVPVVSTALGAEGLAVDHGRELLMADGAEQFAQACLSILSDNGLAEALVARAHETFLAHYEARVVTERLTARVQQLIGSRA